MILVAPRFRLSVMPSVQRGFTLLEMLVVLVIIGLLAGLVGPRLFSKVDQSKVTTAQTQVKLLRGAVESLRLDIGRYPSADEGLALLTRAPMPSPSRCTRWVPTASAAVRADVSVDRHDRCVRPNPS